MIKRLWKRITRGKRTPGVFCGREPRPKRVMHQPRIYIMRHAHVTLREAAEPRWSGSLLVMLTEFNKVRPT